MRKPALFSIMIAAIACGRVESNDDPTPAPPAPPPSSTTTPPPQHEPTLSAAVSLSTDFGSLTGFAYFNRQPAKTFTDCQVHESQPSDTPSAASASAGDIVVDVASEKLTVPYDAKTKAYTFASLDIETKGTMLHVRAPGAEVPAFEATVAAADDVTLTSPTAPLTLSTSSGDIVATWTASANEYVFLDLVVGDEGVTCSFAASAQRGVIPAAYVQQAVANYKAKGVDCNGNACFSFGFIAQRESAVNAGDWKVYVTHAVGSRTGATVQ